MAVGVLHDNAGNKQSAVGITDAYTIKPNLA